MLLQWTSGIYNRPQDDQFDNNRDMSGLGRRQGFLERPNYGRHTFT
jgi:hypothetical protein